MSVGKRFENAVGELARECELAGRSPQKVALVAVSKTVGCDQVQLAIDAGATDFGENRPDQLVEKADRFPDARWHFIGNIQSRRIRDIVGRASLIHSLFEVRHAEKIDEVARERGIVQDVLLEVNVSGEQSKGGCSPVGAGDLLETCLGLANVRVRGLMTMAPRGDMDQARDAFRKLTSLRNELRQTLPESYALTFTELSMGMSEDWRIAVQEGATIVRIGRAVFSDDFA